MTRSPIEDLNDKQLAGCAGLFGGFILFGLLGFGIGLLTATPFQAIGLGIVSSVIGSIMTGIVFWKIS